MRLALGGFGIGMAVGASGVLVWFAYLASQVRR